MRVALLAQLGLRDLAKLVVDERNQAVQRSFIAAGPFA
jgi:hypothetical protein